MMSKYCGSCWISTPRFLGPPRKSESIDSLLAQTTKAHAEAAIEKILPDSHFEKILAARVPGTVLWVDYELARTRGFSVSEQNQMTPALHAELIFRLAVKSIEPGQVPPPDTSLVEVRADRYRDLNTQGAGRSFFLPTGEYVKGGGITPLAGPYGWSGNPGTCSLYEGIIESVMGAVSNNIFSQGATRVLALIDVGDTDDRANLPARRPQALVIRCGNHVRLAHTTEDRLSWFPNRCDRKSLKAIRQSQLAPVKPTNEKTFFQMLAQSHARTAGEQVRWRLSHGVLSDGNMGLFGQMIDFGYFSSQARTAPVHGLDNIWDNPMIIGSVPDPDGHVYRKEVYNRERVLSAIDPKVAGLWRHAYRQNKDIQMLRACGFDAGTAAQLIRRMPREVTRFRKLLMGIAKYHNSGSLDISTSDPSSTSLVDIFNLLRLSPVSFFQGTLTEERVIELLEPNYENDPALHRGWRSTNSFVQKYSRWRAMEARHLTAEFAREFVPLYRDLMVSAADAVARPHSAASKEILRTSYQPGGHLDKSSSFERSIVQRAEFENRPLDELYRFKLSGTIEKIIIDYQEYLQGNLTSQQKEADISQLATRVNRLIAFSMRNIDHLLASGQQSKHPGFLRFQKRTIDGVDYAVRVEAEGRRSLEISGPLNVQKRQPIPTLEFRRQVGAPFVSRDGHRSANGSRFCFELSAEAYDVGVLETRMYEVGSGASNLWVHSASYPFAIPGDGKLAVAPDFFQKHGRKARSLDELKLSCLAYFPFASGRAVR